MLTRRSLLAVTAACALLAKMPLAWAQSDPTAFIVKLGNEMAAVVNGPGSLDEKRRRLTPLIEQSVDVDGIARFCLGRFYRTSTPEQQARFIQLFHAVLIANISGKLGDFQGISFTPTTTVPKDGDTWVGTIIRRPNQQPNNVQWVVGTSGGPLKIVDVVAEGTSLRLTQRSDYAAFITRNNNNVDALLTAMQRQAGG